MDYVDFSGQVNFQEAAEDSGYGTQHYNDQPTNSHDRPIYSSQIPCDIKPRLTKEQHDILEAHFQRQNKPNTNIKKGFAESLNVSLDKVNNWFQNRRAKCKQDAKKAAGSMNIYQAQQQVLNSESEPSPFVTSPDYASMIQTWPDDEEAPNGLGISQTQQTQEREPTHGLPLSNEGSVDQQPHNFEWPPPAREEMYDSPQDVNRRTLTQAQFDAIALNGGMVDGSGNFEDLQSSYAGGQEVWHQVFPQLQTGDPKQQDVFAFPHPFGEPLSSNDSTVPSTISEQSMYGFPVSSTAQINAAMSTSGSDWTDSRSSSLANSQYDGTIPQMAALHQHSTTTSSQWQPGQSVPVDFAARDRENRQRAAAQVAHVSASPQQVHSDEQPLAYPDDEAFMRRNSSTSVLAQSMSHIGIHTPQSNYNATFRSPVPPATIAARRQRARPAALGSASLRSQSHSGAVPPGSPGHVQQHTTLMPGQPVRRVKSSNVINGGVAQGRVMKSVPGSAQRSPLNGNFGDAIHSPHLVRNLSQGNLAPPTPLSAVDFTKSEQPRHYPSWRHTSGHVSRQASISEMDSELGNPYPQSTSVPPQNFTSPPHTPSHWQQQFAQQTFGHNVFTENTPPQSAPASQSCFPSNVFATSHQQMQHPQPQSQAAAQQYIHAMAVPQPQQYVNFPVHEQQKRTPSVTFAPNQQANVVTGPPSGIPLQFANGVPVVNAEGNIQMAFPPQLQLLQQQQAQMQQQQQAQMQQQQQQAQMQQQQQQWQQQAQFMHTPPQAPYAFAPTTGLMPGTQITVQPPKQKTELFVHEYSPPDSVKRSATPRRYQDTAPKTYTFTHTRMEHFEEKKAKKESARSSHSPASSARAFSTT